MSVTWCHCKPSDKQGEFSVSKISKRNRTKASFMRLKFALKLNVLNSSHAITRHTELVQAGRMAPNKQCLFFSKSKWSFHAQKCEFPDKPSDLPWLSYELLCGSLIEMVIKRRSIVVYPILFLSILFSWPQEVVPYWSLDSVSLMGQLFLWIHRFQFTKKTFIPHNGQWLTWNARALNTSRCSLNTVQVLNFWIKSQIGAIQLELLGRRGLQKPVKMNPKFLC